MAAHYGDPETLALFTADAEIEAMLAFEVALAKAQAEMQLIPDEAAHAITQIGQGFMPDLEDLRDGIARDGLVVPALIKALRDAIGEPYAVHLHYGSTSQDVIDTALVLRLKQVFALIQNRLTIVLGLLSDLHTAHGNERVMGRTRMKNALPIRCGDRIRAWSEPLTRQLGRVPVLEARICKLQFGGAVGTNHILVQHAERIGVRVAEILELNAPDTCWHTQRDALADFANWLSLITGTCGKLGQDILIMAQDGVKEIEIAGAGTSSAMPHKQNPVQAEALVTLHRFNAAQLGGMSNALIHENERSGSAWGLEWMILPQMVVATGASLRLTQETLASITRMGQLRD